MTTPAPYLATTQFFTGRMPFLPPNQQRQSTDGHWKNCSIIYFDHLHPFIKVVPNQNAQLTSVQYQKEAVLVCE